MGIESRVDSKMHAADLGPGAHSTYNGGMTTVLLFNSLGGRGQFGKKCPLPKARLRRRMHVPCPAASGQALQNPGGTSHSDGRYRLLMRHAIRRNHHATPASSVPQRGRNAIRIRRYDGVIASSGRDHLSGNA